MSRQETIEIMYDPEVNPELGAYEFLQDSGYEVCINKFDMMEEADWVVLRLIFAMPDFPEEAIKAMEYLVDKYGREVYQACGMRLLESGVELK